MEKNSIHQKRFFLLFIFIFVAFLLHFYNINWGAPFYFHPDERNIASTVSQLLFPSNMNPHFFAYGSLPIYVIYFSGVLINFLLRLPIKTVSFSQAIVISRLYSAFFSTLLVPLLFALGKKIKNNTTGMIAAYFAATSVGFVQFAHFGTFEMWLTFFSGLLFLLCLKVIETNNDYPLLLLGLVFGLLVATKISLLAILPIPVLAIFLQQIHHFHNKGIFKKSMRILQRVFIFFVVSLLIYVFTNPFVFLDSGSFLSSMHYETGVALGTLPVFYSGEFYGTIPILFQMIKVYPFLLNPLLSVIFIPSFIYFLFKTIITKKNSYILLITLFLVLFLSQAFLFVKWTRYVVPTLPFIYLFCAVGILDFIEVLQKKYRALSISYFIVYIIFITSIVFTFSFFYTVFVQLDTRIAALNFVQKDVPEQAHILSEVYDLGITPFNSSFHEITLFNFYDLDNNSPTDNQTTLQSTLAKADYIILPSQRILKTRLINKNKFPNGYNFYSALTHNALGFIKIYESPCDIFCKITYLNSPVLRFEETVNVFDRPTVSIYKREY